MLRRLLTAVGFGLLSLGALLRYEYNHGLLPALLAVVSASICMAIAVGILREVTSG